MGLEVGTFVNDLVITNPPGTDPILQGDDHLRLVKSVLKSTFPNADKAFAFPDAITKTAAYPVVKADINKFFQGDATAGAFSFTLPTLVAADDGWCAIFVKSDASANAVTLVGTINGVVNLVLGAQYKVALVWWTGTAWLAFVSSTSDVTLAGANAFTGNNTFAGTSIFNNTVTIAKEWALSGDISPAQITASQNDYAPTGHATASVFRLDLDAAWNITGLAGGTDGRLVIIYNTSAFSLTLTHEDAASAAANRFTLIASASIIIAAGGGLLIQYDSTSSRWRVVFPLRLATQANMEAESSSANPYVAPHVQHYHPGHPKFWGHATVAAGVPTLQASYNVTSITDDGVGLLTVTIATDFSSANWAHNASVEDPDSAAIRGIMASGKAAGSIVLRCILEGGGLTDPVAWDIAGFGDQA